MSATSLLAAVGNSFGPIIPSVSDANGNLQTCAAGWGGLVQVVGGAVGFAISLGIIITVLMVAYGGFVWVTNPINPENRSQAKKVLLNAAIGLVLTLAAWLIVNTLLTVLGYTGGVTGATSALFTGGDICIPQRASGTLGGTGTGGTGITTGGDDQCPGNLVCSSSGTCQEDPQLNVGDGTQGAACRQDAADNCQDPLQCSNVGLCEPAGQDQALPQSCSTSSSNPGQGGQVATNVCNAANSAFKTLSTANAPGTNGGREACAWAVGTIVQSAGYQGFSSNVSNLEGQLTGGRGTVEAQSAAVCGDIVVQAGDHHVGICMNAGCSVVYSNSSSEASFSWSSGPSFLPSYKDGIGRFYRLNN